MQTAEMLFVKRCDSDKEHDTEQDADLILYYSALRNRRGKQKAAHTIAIRQLSVRRILWELRCAQRWERAYTVAITVLIALLSAGSGAAVALAWALAR